MNFGFLISAKIKLVFNSALFLSLGDKIKRGKQEGHGNTEQWGQRDTKQRKTEDISTQRIADGKQGRTQLEQQNR